MTQTLGCGARPVSTIASCPVMRPAIAKWLDERASFRSPVRGDLATTANLALVVSGVPTSGENTNTIGASGPSGSTPAGVSSRARWTPSPAPPIRLRITASGISRRSAAPVERSISR